MKTLNVRIAYDPRSRVWVTERSEVPGLTAIDESQPGLVSQIHEVARGLLNLNRNSSRFEPSPEYEIRILEWKPDWSLSDERANAAAAVVDRFTVSLPSATLL